MRVGLLLAGMRMGGSENLSLNICKAGQNQLLEFVVIASRGGLLLPIFKEQCIVHLLSRKLPIDPLYVIRLIRLCKREHIDILHSHQLIECLNAWVANVFLKRKLFFTYHGFYYLEGFLLRIVGSFLRKRVNANIFVSEHLKDFYLRNYDFNKANSVLLYNGVNISGIQYSENSLKKIYCNGHNVILLGMIANFGSARDQLSVCKAFYEIRKKSSFEIHLVFIGRPDLGSNSNYQKVIDYCLGNELGNSVHFTGEIINASKLLIEFDIFLYCSLRETFSLSVAEAMIAGIPVIANDIPAICEITENGKYAYLYKSGNYLDMANIALNTLQNLEDYKRTAQANKLIVADKFSVQKHIDDLYHIYTKY